MPATAAQRLPEKREARRLFHSPEKRRLILCLLLAVATLLLYNPVSRHDFVNYDDDQYVFENAHVRAGLTWGTFVWAFTTNDAGNWHPPTWLSHALDCQLFHLNPAGHHYTNLLLHFSNVLLLFLLLERITGFTWRSLAVAALFALHPLNVESVAWIAERKNLLCTFFLLLAIGAYAWYARKPGIGRYLLVAVFFAFGLMSKPMIITFPFVLLLLDYWPLCRIDSHSQQKPLRDKTESVSANSWPALILEKLPLLAISIASAVVTIWAQQAGGAVRSVTEYPLSARLGNALVSYVRYLAKAFWPTHLSVMYPHPGNTLAWWQIAGSALLLVVITAGVLRFRNHRCVAVGWFWYLGTLVPVIGIIQVGRQAMADRYTYIPLIGIFVLLVWGTTTILRQRISPNYLATLALLTVAGLTLVTRTQVSYWTDSVSLWSHALAVTGPNFVAQDNLGQALITQGKVAEALQHFQEAAKIDPTDPAAQMGIGVLRLRQGDRASSIQHFQNVLSLTRSPRLRAYAMTNLGSTYRQLGDYQRARENYESALSEQPDTVIALLGLGLICDKTSDPTHAATYYSQAVALEPSDVAYLLLARALEQSGRVAEAARAREQAQQLSGNLDEATGLANKLLAE